MLINIWTGVASCFKFICVRVCTGLSHLHPDPANRSDYGTVFAEFNTLYGLSHLKQIPGNGSYPNLSLQCPSWAHTHTQANTAYTNTYQTVPISIGRLVAQLIFEWRLGATAGHLRKEIKFCICERLSCGQCDAPVWSSFAWWVIRKDGIGASRWSADWISNSYRTRPSLYMAHQKSLFRIFRFGWIESKWNDLMAAGIRSIWPDWMWMAGGGRWWWSRFIGWIVKMN